MSPQSSPVRSMSSILKPIHTVFRQNLWLCQYTYLWTCSIYLPTVLSTSGKTHQFPSHAPWCIFPSRLRTGAGWSSRIHLSSFVLRILVSRTDSILLQIPKAGYRIQPSPFWYSPANSQFCWHHWIWIFPRSSFFYSVGYLSDTKIIK